MMKCFEIIIKTVMTFLVFLCFGLASVMFYTMISGHKTQRQLTTEDYKQQCLEAKGLWIDYSNFCIKRDTVIPHDK